MYSYKIGEKFEGLKIHKNESRDSLDLEHCKPYSLFNRRLETLLDTLALVKHPVEAPLEVEDVLGEVGAVDVEVTLRILHPRVIRHGLP